jgi:hypothetical protein
MARMCVQCGSDGMSVVLHNYDTYPFLPCRSADMACAMDFMDLFSEPNPYAF